MHDRVTMIQILIIYGKCYRLKKSSILTSDTIGKSTIPSSVVKVNEYEL